MVQANTISQLAALLKARRSALQQAYEANAAQLGYDDEDEPGCADNVASLLNSEFRELRALNHAIELQQLGMYGRCEECARPIAAARLRAIPQATLCIDCQRCADRVA